MVDILDILDILGVLGVLGVLGGALLSSLTSDFNIRYSGNYNVISPPHPC
ncbi:TPA: hypothetical protein ACP2MC_004839 [Escherichia coli]